MSITENTINDLMCQYLRSEGLSISSQRTMRTINGSYGKPDFWLENSGIFLGEGEWEEKKSIGWAQAHDYCNSPVAAGSFLIFYPNKLKITLSQKRFDEKPEIYLRGYKYHVAFLRPEEKTDMARLSLEEIPFWLNSNINRERIPFTDTDEIIKIMHEAVQQLTIELKGVRDIPDIFQDILGTLPEEEEIVSAIRDAASYFLLNQITFYRILSSARKELPNIEPDMLKSPSDLNMFFNKALEIDYSPVFGYDIASDLSLKSLNILKTTIKMIYAFSLERISYDIIGKVFHSLIPLSVRKRVAAYYTKNTAAILLSNLVISDSNDLVMDPACGSGTLLVSSYQRKLDLINKNGKEFTEIEHRRFLERDITGIDIMPFAAHLSTIHLSLQIPIFNTERVRICIYDFLDLNPNEIILPLSKFMPLAKFQRKLFEFKSQKPDISKDIVKRGAIEIDSKILDKIELTPVDVVIMNPPFTFIRRLEKEYLNSINNKMKVEGKEKYIVGQPGLHAYFIFHADSFLKPNGMMAAVLPQSILHYTQTIGIQDFLIDNYWIKYIISSETETTFSDQSDFKEILFIAEKCKSNKPTIFITLKNTLSLKNSFSYAEKILNLSYIDYEDDEIRFNLVPHTKLKSDRHWVRFLRSLPILEKIRKISKDKIVQGSSVYPSSNKGVRRGAYIYGKHFFFIPNKYWKIEKDVEEYVVIREVNNNYSLKISKKYLYSSLRSPRIHGYEIFPKATHYVVSIPRNSRPNLQGDITKYIDWGEEFLSNKELSAKKMKGKQWYSSMWEQTRAEFGHICIPEKFMPTNRGVSAHFIDTDTKVPVSFYTLETGDIEKDKALVLWFNSSIGIAFRYEYRAVIGKASERLTGKHLQELETLNVNKLSKDDIKKLVDKFDNVVEQQPLPNYIDQINFDLRKEIDIIILEILGIPKDELSHFQGILEKSIKNWIDEIQLRT